MKEAILHFPTAGKPVDFKQIKSGHIHKTYLVTTDTGDIYVLQWLNRYVFPNIDAIMDNMAAISTYLRSHPELEVPMISYIDTVEGAHYYDEGEGGCWRCYRFVDDSVCYQKAADVEDFRESARAFGRFQYALNGFDANNLQETIENFHNTADRYRQLREAAENDSAGRCSEVAKELEFAFAREEKACSLHRMREDGLLPVRATHNDTKINNVLFNKYTNKAICVIDLDTVMPGLSAYDFGDAIRFGASTADEDEPDVSRVALDLELFRAFAEGFVEVCPSLTEKEIEVLPLGAYVMTIECGTRFLADYINGDKYFSIDRPEQNLDRARTQFKLISDMEAKWDEMCGIVEAVAKKYR